LQWNYRPRDVYCKGPNGTVKKGLWVNPLADKKITIICYCCKRVYCGIEFEEHAFLRTRTPTTSIKVAKTGDPISTLSLGTPPTVCEGVIVIDDDDESDVELPTTTNHNQGKLCTSYTQVMHKLCTSYAQVLYTIFTKVLCPQKLRFMTFGGFAGGGSSPSTPAKPTFHKRAKTTSGKQRVTFTFRA
jgi:hypothetical protein